jgi:RNA polymerase sigma-70 factor (ECF subfamily)
MYHVAKSILKDDFLAEDAVHNAFLKIINHLDRLKDVFCHTTRGFLVIVVKNTSRDIYNKRKAGSLVFFDEMSNEIAGGVQLEEDVFRRLEAEELSVKIGLLPEMYREVLLLRHIQDYSHKEIARMLDINEAAVRKRLERARQKLFSIIGEEAAVNA